MAARDTSDAARRVQREALARFFQERAFPILTPMAVDPAHPSPHYHNRSLYLAAMLERKRGLGPKQMFAVVQVPHVLPRLVPVGQGGAAHFILLEDAMSAWLPELFGGFAVLTWTTFRITRDSDIELLEQESDDMLRLIEDRLKARSASRAIIRSSSVGTTSTVTFESSVEMRHTSSKPRASRLRCSSSVMPMQPNPCNASARTIALPCPIPPVNTTASIPPIAAT